MAAVMAGGVHVLAVVEPVIAVVLVTCAPRLAAKVVPYAVLALTVEGLVLAKDYHDGFNNQVLYGLVLAGDGAWRTNLVLPEAGSSSSSVCGCWSRCGRPAPDRSGRWPGAGWTPAAAASRPGRPADATGARGARADGRGTVQRRDRPAAVHHRESGEQARGGYLRQAGPGAFGRRQPPCPGGAGLPWFLTDGKGMTGWMPNCCGRRRRPRASC